MAKKKATKKQATPKTTGGGKSKQTISKNTDQKHKEIMQTIDDTPSNKNEQLNEQVSQTTTQNTEQNTNQTTSDIGTDDIVKALKIPLEDAKVDNNNHVQDALFNNKKESEFKAVEFESDNDDFGNAYNDKMDEMYLDDQSDDMFNDSDIDSSFFDDEELMAEVGVEVIDMLFSYGAMGIAGDFENPEKYEVSDRKKNKIKKPLAKLLAKRGAKVSPEIMFAVLVLITYSPIMFSAVQVRMKKKKAKKVKAKTPDIADVIPDEIEEVDIPSPMEVPPTKRNKKRGRPKGSKDKGQRNTAGYKGNTNAK
jgi:hypothetical protein